MDALRETEKDCCARCEIGHSYFAPADNSEKCRGFLCEHGVTAVVLQYAADFVGCVIAYAQCLLHKHESDVKSGNVGGEQQCQRDVFADTCIYVSGNAKE